ncbi:hypothetical protein M080_7399 [Bacteroides fragilis str. 3397 T10]|nr:hypothetical protein M080_7399 [Bacteroides fragilis str. 3397 T10]
MSIHSLIRLHQRTTVHFSVHPYFNQSIRIWGQQPVCPHTPAFDHWDR